MATQLRSVGYFSSLKNPPEVIRRASILSLKVLRLLAPRVEPEIEIQISSQTQSPHSECWLEAIEQHSE